MSEPPKTTTVYLVEQQATADQWVPRASFKNKEAALLALQSDRLEYPKGFFRLVVTTQTEVIEA